MQRALIGVVLLYLVCVLPVENKPAGSSQDLSVCKLPAARGHCRALIPRWTYNGNTGKCEEFAYGGCDGNDNNFRTYKDCMALCENVF